jgi:hypothetical protein
MIPPLFFYPLAVLPTFKGGYKLERNFGEKCQKWVVARYSAGHFEHYGDNISVFIGPFLSPPSLQIEKKHLFLRDFVNVGAKIVWFYLTP